MTIDTIETALADMARKLQKQEISDRARDAISDGKSLEIVITVAGKRDGASVTMVSRGTEPPKSHGRLIRLK